MVTIPHNEKQPHQIHQPTKKSAYNSLTYYYRHLNLEQTVKSIRIQK